MSDAPEGMRLCKPPAPIFGDDVICKDCGRILVKINEDGTFYQAEETTLRGGITINGITGDQKGEILEALCLECHPDAELDSSPPPEMLEHGVLIPIPLPAELAEKLIEAVMPMIASLQGQSERNIDTRIKPPWENGS